MSGRRKVMSAWCRQKTPPEARDRHWEVSHRLACISLRAPAPGRAALVGDVACDTTVIMEERSAFCHQVPRRSGVLNLTMPTVNSSSRVRDDLRSLSCKTTFAARLGQSIVITYLNKAILRKLLCPRSVTYLLEYAFTFTFVTGIFADLRNCALSVTALIGLVTSTFDLLSFDL